MFLGNRNGRALLLQRKADYARGRRQVQRNGVRRGYGGALRGALL